MQSLVGVFRTRSAAEETVRSLLDSGIPEKSIVYLTGETGATHAKTLPTTDESQETQQTTGALVGGAVGVSAGLPLGGAIATFLLPGIGTVVAFGLGAAAWLGLSGAAVGAVVGEKTRKESRQPETSLTKDNVSFYHGLLKRGRSLVVVHIQREEDAPTIRAVFQRRGAQDIEISQRAWGEAA
jgi:hypothetical protein